MITTILLAVSLLLNILLLIGVRNLLRQTNQLEAKILEEREIMYEKTLTTLERMKDADLNGAFESDDEVGGAFEDIKDILIELNESI